MAATLMAITGGMSEDGRFVGAQSSPATPYWSYKVAGCFPLGGGATIASIPELAGSGSGSEGWQMLFSWPVRPELPSEHRPSRPPMSPMPGTEHRPPAGVTSATVVADTAACPLPPVEVPGA